MDNTEASHPLFWTHQSLAQKIAGYYYKNRHILELEYEDFVQYAYIGLMEAAQKYRPETNVPFQYYAGQRIKGAILNGIEKWTEKQQQISFRAQLKKERKASIFKESQKAADADLFYELVENSIEWTFSYMLSDWVCLMEAEKDDPTEDNDEKAFINTLFEKMIQRLNDAEQKVIRDHYFHEIPFQTISETMGISKGRVSQIHKKALENMKKWYKSLYHLELEW